MVLPPQKPTIEINGTSNLPRDYEDFRLGVRVFSDVRITISSDRDDNEEWRNGNNASNIWNIKWMWSEDDMCDTHFLEELFQFLWLSKKDSTNALWKFY